ncbi:MAG: peptidylprolyl isomerase [Methylotenera sp.]|nr:peptidylprolyl isomerase [Oligoflexia bacterium]
MKKMNCLGMSIGIILTLSSAHATEIAKVNNRPITDRDVQMSLSGFNEGQRKNVLSDANSRREIVSNIIDQELLTQEGEKQKLDQDQDYKDALNGFRKQYLSSKLLQKNLASKLTDSAAKKYYESHKMNYSTDQIQVQHILIADEAKALEVLKKAQAPNADFQELAEKFSKDPSAKNNRGDIGVITRDSPFVAEFKNAAFESKKGEIVGPIKTLYGYHIIKVVDKKIGKPLEYDEVELKVKNDLRQEFVQVYVAQLRKAAKVSIDEKAVGKL